MYPSIRLYSYTAYVCHLFVIKTWCQYFQSRVSQILFQYFWNIFWKYSISRCEQYWHCILFAYICSVRIQTVSADSLKSIGRYFDLLPICIPQSGFSFILHMYADPLVYHSYSVIRCHCTSVWRLIPWYQYLSLATFFLFCCILYCLCMQSGYISTQSVSTASANTAYVCDFFVIRTCCRYVYLNTVVFLHCICMQSFCHNIGRYIFEYF